MDRGSWQATVYAVASIRHDLATKERESGEKGMLLHCWCECKLIQPLWKTVWRFLKKLGIKPPYDPAIPLLAYILRKPKLKKTHVSHC